MAYANSYPTSRTRGKWWIPKTEEQKRLFESAKQDVICFLTINMKEGIKAKFAYSRMMDQMDTQIDYRKIGFNSFSEFLYHIDDILCVKSGPDGQEYIFLRNSATGNQDISHITALVKGQSASSKGRGLKVKQSNSRFIPTERLLQINCERGVGPASSSAASSTSSLQSRPPPSFRPKPRFSGRQSQRSFGSSRVHTLRSINSIPALKPVNAAAVSLVSSRPATIPSRGNVPTLKPLQQQNQTRSVVMSNRPTMRVLTTQPRSSSSFSSQPSTRPKLLPLSELRNLNPNTSLQSNIQRNREEQENTRGVIRSNLSSVPQLKPLGQSLNNIPNNSPSVHSNKEENGSDTKMEEDVNDAYSGDEEDAIEDSGDEFEDFEFSNESQNENLSIKERGDECDGDLRVGIRVPSSTPSQNFTAITQYGKEVLGRKEKTSSSTANGEEDDGERLSSFKFTSFQKELEATSRKSIQSSSFNKKKISKRLKVSQMSLASNSSFKGVLLGADAHGYLFVKRTDMAVVENSFNIFHNQRQALYSNPKIQEEMRMDPNVIENGVYVVAFVNGSFIRGKVQEKCTPHDICIVFDIDNCEYHFVCKKDVYHINDEFTMRHPQAIMVVLRNTEKYVLTSKFEELVSPAFENISQNIVVTDVTAPHPLFRCPIVSIKINTADGQDLYEILKIYSPQLESNNTTILTSLSQEQQETLQDLIKQGHVVSTISM